MSSQRPRAPRGHYKRFVSRGFCQLMNTTNLEKTICGLLFVLRFVTFSKHSNPGTDIRSNVVELFDQRNIQHSSVDLVRFSWVEDDEDAGDDNEDIEEGDEDIEGSDGDTGHVDLESTTVPSPLSLHSLSFCDSLSFLCHLSFIDADRCFDCRTAV